MLPAGVTYRQLDVRSDADWAAACEAIERDWGGLDLLVNNAGIAAGGRIDVAETVSYTHLDVYKRQELELPAHRPASPEM